MMSCLGLGVASACSNPIEVVPQSTLHISLLFHECYMSPSFDCPQSWVMNAIHGVPHCAIFPSSCYFQFQRFLGTQISNTFSLNI